MCKKRTLRRIVKLLLILSLITFWGAFALYIFRPAAPASAEDEMTASEPAPPAADNAATADASLSPLPEPSPENPLPSTEPEPEAHTVTLMAVGDNLIHMGVVRTGKQEDGTYDFSFLFRGISDLLEAADIKIINQETILGGNQLGFSGFPLFNSPTEVGEGIAASGFNVVLQASNHSADQGLAGIENCIAFWEQHPEVLMAGIHEKEDAEKTIPLLTVEDTTFAILNYTYGPNAEILPSDIQGHLDMLCAYDEKTGAMDFTTLNPSVTEDIRAAEKVADAVIVCPHWGTEYSSTPSRYQREFALQMTEAGADLIIGTHPHVVQPVEWIEAKNGNRALCFYSLGNYVSTQKKPLCMLEALAWVSFDVTDDGVFVSEERSGVIPLVCHYTSGPVRIEDIYLLEDYTEEQATSHGIRNYGEAPLTLPQLLQWRDEILGDAALTAREALADAP